MKVRLTLEAEYDLPRADGISEEELLELERQYIQNDLRLAVVADGGKFSFSVFPLEPKS